MKPKKKTPARRARSKEDAEEGSSALVREEATQARPLSARERITVDPAVMGGRPCIRGMRVTVGTILGLLAKGHSRAKVLKLYPYLKTEDIDAALAYGAKRADELGPAPAPTGRLSKLAERWAGKFKLPKPEPSNPRLTILLGRRLKKMRGFLKGIDTAVPREADRA